MLYLFSFSRYQTTCVIEFLFRELMTSSTLRFISDHPLKQWRRRIEIWKFEYLENEKSFLDQIKSIFHSFWRTIIWWKNKDLIKLAGTSFNNCIGRTKLWKNFIWLKEIYLAVAFELIIEATICIAKLFCFYQGHPVFFGFSTSWIL